jgi:excisionase family DNA binding protein
MTEPSASADGSPAEPASGDLNLKQAARRLGVHYMTAYRYVRQGRLAGERDGTTWRVSGVAVEELIAGRAAGDQTCRPTSGTGPRADWAERLSRCLLAGDEAASWRVVQSALAAGHSPTFCYVDMLSNALASIGARWDGGEISVADQYVATGVATRIVARLGAAYRRPGRSRGVVVFGAPLGELHGLPVSIAADLVRLAGFSVLELGANVPPEAFAAAAERAPRLVAVGIGITVSGSIASAQETVTAIRAVDPVVPIIIGGQAALSAASSGLRGVTTWVDDGPAAVRALEDLAAGRRVAEGRTAGRRPAPGKREEVADAARKIDAGPAVTQAW